jgi:hypothetical protein
MVISSMNLFHASSSPSQPIVQSLGSCKEFRKLEFELSSLVRPDSYSICLPLSRRTDTKATTQYNFSPMHLPCLLCVSLSTSSATDAGARSLQHMNHESLVPFRGMVPGVRFFTKPNHRERTFEERTFRTAGDRRAHWHFSSSAIQRLEIPRRGHAHPPPQSSSILLLTRQLLEEIKTYLDHCQSLKAG